MTRRGLRAALLITAAALAPTCPARAATTVTGPITGQVLAAGLSGDGLVLVRRADDGALRVERRVPGQPVRVLATLPKRTEAYGVLIAAGPAAVAVSYVGGNGIDTPSAPSSVLVGPPTGPLRTVATCAAAYTAPAVAVDGTHVAWGDGGCAGPTRAPDEIAPSAVAVGDVDPAVPVQRSALPADTLPAALVLQGTSGTVGVLRPTFFGTSSDIRSFGPEGLGEVRLKLSGSVSLPFGTLADGSVAIFRTSGARYGGFDDYEDSRRARCDSGAGILRPGATALASLDLGGCSQPDYPLGFASPAILAGDQITARIDLREREGVYAHAYDRRLEPSGYDRVRITRTPVAGGTPTTFAATDYRDLRNVVADATRVGFSEVRCQGGYAMVLTDTPAGTVSPCTARVLTKRALVKSAATTITLDCPRGCSGRMVDASECRTKLMKTFSFGPGKHAVRVRPVARSIHRGRLFLHVELRGAPSPFQEIPLKRLT